MNVSDFNISKAILANGQVVYTAIRDGETMGYVVIDSLVAGRARGGLRMLPDINEHEMRCVARSMTLKYGFLGLPQGGGKAGVRGDPEASRGERRALLERFGRAVSPLLKRRIYVPDTDMGTTNADIQYLLGSLGITPKKREYRGVDSGYYTALTTMAGAGRAAAHLGMSLTGAKVAIEGFGKVGSALAGLMAAKGVRVVGVSTSRGAIYAEAGLDASRLQEVSEKEGSRLVDYYPGVHRSGRDELLELPVDVLFPCARNDSIHGGNAARIKARIVCPGANNAVTPDAERMLLERDILSMPDFITNCGGVLGGTMEFAGLSRGRIRQFIDHQIGERMSGVLSASKARGVPPRQIATGLALSNFENIRRRSETPSAIGKLFNLALEIYRRGGLPGAVVARFSLPYFERCLAR